MKAKFHQIFSQKTNFYILGFVLFNFILTPHVIIKNNISSTKIAIIIIFIELLLDIFFIFLLHFIQKKHLPIEKTFLILCLSLGFCMILFLPTGESPDEYAHITRAWSISNGNIIANVNDEGTPFVTLPIELKTYCDLDNTDKSYSQLLDRLTTTPTGEVFDETRRFPDTASYNFIPYIPQSIGISIGKILHLPVAYILYLGRFLALLTFALITYFAIKLLPKFKPFMVILALLPITLQQAASFSADSLTICIVFFTTAYALHLIYSDTSTLSKKQIFYIYLLAIIIALCKTVYFPLCALFLFIPTKKFGNAKVKYTNAIFAIILAISITLLMMKVQPPSLKLYDGQIDFIKSNPFTFIFIIIGTLFDYNTALYIYGATGICLGYFDISIPTIYSFIILVLFVIYFLSEKEKIKITNGLRITAWLIFSGIIIIIMSALYIQWTATEAKVVDGVQGRYFLPILPLLPLMLHKNNPPKFNTNVSFNPQIATIVCVFFNLCAFLCIFATNVPV